MLVIAHHHINNPKEFWNAAKEHTKTLPVSLKLHSIYVAADQKMGTCIWEANSVEDVQRFIDKFTGKFSKNYCYELNEKESMGLPVIKQSMAHAN